MQNEMLNERLKQTTYYYVFNDYEGSTGFDLIERLNKDDFSYLVGLAMHLLECYRNKEQI